MSTHGLSVRRASECVTNGKHEGRDRVVNREGEQIGWIDGDTIRGISGDDDGFIIGWINDQEKIIMRGSLANGD